MALAQHFTHSDTIDNLSIVVKGKIASPDFVPHRVRNVSPIWLHAASHCENDAGGRRNLVKLATVNNIFKTFHHW